MKQKDIALIIVIVFFSALVSFFVSGKVFVAAGRTQKAEIVDVINSNFNPPSTKYYNSKSIDPTQLVQVGNNNNPNPFNGQTP